MGQEYRRTTTTVSLINYHFVFCPRYRRKVLVKDVDRRFREILQEVCDEHKLIIVALEVMPDHVQLLVNALSSISPSDIIDTLPDKRQGGEKLKRKKKKYDESGQLIREEPDQLLTAKAKIVKLSDQAALLLGLAGYAATKMWNVANYERRVVWQETGQIPGFPDQCKTLKTNRWYKLLPSQTAQEVLAELDDSYRSWYSHRKNGDLLAKPPGFRKKDTLSTLTFKQNAFGMPGE
ncbi:MAG: IS200/IS605 family transposase, partial [Clostridia bacterium]|nr:IS200/IS605 family transposase [Clostridia bacterium]